MTYKLNEAKMFADITDGFAIVINSETGVYYGMNPFASSIFENLINGVSTELILSKVSSMNEVPRNFSQIFDEFVEGLLAKELIIPGVGGG